jgi:Ca-activated chloride channel family protein
MLLRLSSLGTVLGSAMWIAGQLAVPTVTVAVAVQDPRGDFIPNLRPENFAVFEDGVRRRDVVVGIEHAPVTLGVLVEGGGRYQQLNQILTTEIPSLARPIVEAVGREDTVGLFSYTDAIKPLADFDHHSRDTLESAITRLPATGFSEANLYDALVTLFDRMQPIDGRKAILLLSTGLDTFSHATFDDVVQKAERAGTPVYAVGIAGLVERTLFGYAGPMARLNWRRASAQLKTVARVSGGRAYLRETDLDVPAAYDDMMEHLRVRYVLTFPASRPLGTGQAPAVRVELVDARTGSPLRLNGGPGRLIAATVR